MPLIAASCNTTAKNAVCHHGLSRDKRNSNKLRGGRIVFSNYTTVFYVIILKIAKKILLLHQKNTLRN